MSKEGTPIRYDLYKPPTTPRLPLVFVESFKADDTTDLFKLATRTFHFDRTRMLQFVQHHHFNKAMIVSKSGAGIIKVFSDCNIPQRIVADKARIEGIYEKDMSEKRAKELEYYKAELDKLIKLAGQVV